MLRTTEEELVQNLLIQKKNFKGLCPLLEFYEIFMALCFVASGWLLHFVCFIWATLYQQSEDLPYITFKK